VEVDELRDGVRIRAKSWVGVLSFHEIEVRIVPKLAGGNLGLVDLLMYTTGLGALKRQSGLRTLNFDREGSLFDLLALLFSQSCERILAEGLLYDYITVEDDLPILRGRLLVDRQIRQRMGRVDRLECRFDDHSSNIFENKLLAVALQKCSRLVSDRVVLNKVKRLFTLFTEVCNPADLDLLTAKSELIYNRLNSYYKEGHDLAILILEGLELENLFASGSTRSFVFLLDMNRLFEMFVSKLVAQILLGHQCEVRSQRHDGSIIWDLYRNRSYAQVIPDLLVTNIGSPSTTLAIDAKYKIYDEQKVNAGDIYQVFLYTYAYNLTAQERPIALLIYPTEQKTERQSVLAIRPLSREPGARIHVIGINIRQTLKELELQSGSGIQFLKSAIITALEGI
jgi:5-methylcytosine-specific restriction enzyme subunit McrC